MTNRSTKDKRVTVFGDGACGRGVAAHFRNAFAEVSVVEIDPVTRLEALLDGFAVPDKAEALRRADVVITATGARGVVAAADLPLLPDDVVLMNVGHFPLEIDVPAVRAAAQETIDAADGIETLRLPRPAPPPSHRRAHGQPRRPPPAGELDRVDGPRVRAPGALPRGRRHRSSRSR
jgi:adenosylhomocysteinase